MTLPPRAQVTLMPAMRRVNSFRELYLSHATPGRPPGTLFSLLLGLLEAQESGSRLQAKG